MLGSPPVTTSVVPTFGFRTAPTAGCRMTATGKLFGGASTTLIVRVCVVVSPVASVTWTVKVFAPRAKSACGNGSHPLEPPTGNPGPSQTTSAHDTSWLKSKTVASEGIGTKRKYVRVVDGSSMVRNGGSASA